VALRNLVRLWAATGQERYRAEAEKGFKTFAGSLRTYPQTLTTMLQALDLYLDIKEARAKAKEEKGPGKAEVKQISAEGPKKPDAAVIAIERGGGFVNPDKNPFAYYWFTVAKDGAWELKPLKGKSLKGKLGAAEVNKWVKGIEAGGFAKLKSNPALGAADEPFLDITLRVNGKVERKRIPLQEKLAQALEKKIAKLARPGK
jgi:hypothetical protein